MNSQIIMDTHNHDSSVRDYYHPQGSNKDYHLANYRIYKENNNHQNPHLQQQNPYASMDQTFHTPSFGDEDFNISPSSYHHPPLDPSHMPPQQQQQYQMAPPSHDQYHHQWHHDQSQAPQMYMPQYIPNNNMGASSQQHSMQSPLHHSQLQQATSQQQQQQHISPQHVGGSPYVGHAGTTHQQSPPQGRPSPLEHNGTSEDSDDAIPATTLKRPSPDPYLETNGKGGVAANKKAKVPKKKKKKDPNEPQKPVSAYALFFRDTQAAIKGTTPNATFGEVSKIVASMWDVLDADNKSVYKKRTEVAKKEYLKALAAYRANAVSKESGGSDQSPTNMYSPPHEQAQHQQMQQQHHPPPQSPHAMHQSPQQHMPTPQQMQSPPQQLHPHHPHTQYQYSSPPMQQMGPPQMSSPNQMMEQHHHWGQQGPQQPQQPSQMTAPGAIVSQQQPPSQQQSMPGPPQLCIRDGCRNPAISNSDWEDEYCSNECVITHCRDVFGNWVQQQSYSAVK